jgi:hypothetical protein
MKQAVAFLLAIFRPLGALVELLRVVLDWRARMDGILADPELVRDLRETESGRITLESAIAFGEHWINIIIAARTCEIAGLSRRAGFSPDWKGWAPARARSWDELMQRYRRLCASLNAIERAARRRAARIVRQRDVCACEGSRDVYVADDAPLHRGAAPGYMHARADSCAVAAGLYIRAPP